MDDDIVNSENYLDMSLLDEEIEITPEIIENAVNTTPIVTDIANELTEKESEPAKIDQTDKNKPETVKFTQLPLARIKTIMKMDPDVNLASSDAVFAVTKATELFIDSIAKEAYSYTAKGKRKIITKKDLDAVIDTVDCLCFLEGAMDI